MPWLVRGDDVLASAEVAVTRKVAPPRAARPGSPRRRARAAPCRQVHTFGMQFPIDVAFCDRYGFVLHVSRMRPGSGLALRVPRLLRDRGVGGVVRPLGDRPRRHRRGARLTPNAHRHPSAGTDGRHNGGPRAERDPREPVLRHDAHLLRERRAPHRARVHDGRGDVLTRWHRLLGDEVFYPHRHRRARPEGPAGRGGEGARARASSCSRSRACSARSGTRSTSPTTTSSAPPSPATTRRCRSSCSCIYDAGDIELGTYEGLYCVSCEALLRRRRAGRRQLPDPRPARSST